MKKIYTKTGDKGETSLKNGVRVRKTDIRIETNGTLDELNTSIGMVRAGLETNHQWQSMLRLIQLNIMKLMSFIATVAEPNENSGLSIGEDQIAEIEKWIDDISSDSTPSEYFILPGGTAVSSFLHFARVSARRAERMLYRLNDEHPVPEKALIYINRLSDLFFVMARYEMQQSGIDEERWKMFSSRLGNKP